MGVFCSDWDKIIERLRTLNSGCTLVVMTVYNPYNHSRHLRRRLRIGGCGS